jgi:hypothetical protein
MLQILNSIAFLAIKRKLTYYVLKLMILEWFATKRIANNIKDKKEKEFKFNPNISYTLSYKLLTKYSLPCKH